MRWIGRLGGGLMVLSVLVWGVAHPFASALLTVASALMFGSGVLCLALGFCLRHHPPAAR